MVYSASLVEGRFDVQGIRRLIVIILLALYVGVSITNSTAFLKVDIAGYSVFHYVILITAIYLIVSYTRALREGISLSKWQVICLVFCAVGGLAVLGSVMGLYRPLIQDRLYQNDSYIARQAYYLFFLLLLPVIGFMPSRIDKLISAVRRHPVISFLLLYFAFALYGRSVALKVNITLLLAAIVLLYEKKTVSYWILSLIIVLSPIGVGGELTQVVIRVIFACLVLSKDTLLSERVCKYVHVATIGCVMLTLLSGVIVGLMPFKLDANSSWRLNYWADETESLAQTFGIGVGFGSSYASADFVLESLADSPGGPFATDQNYSATEKLYVIGSHNSFVSIMFRTGVLGITLFLLMVQSIYKGMPTDNSLALGAFLLDGAILISAFNVGLESPLYLFTFLFCLGMSTLSLKSDSDTPALSRVAE